MLRELQKNTLEIDPDYVLVQSALTAISNVVQFVNNKRGEAEQKAKMATLISQIEYDEVTVFDHRN